jgi:hypothetical protein
LSQASLLRAPLPDGIRHALLSAVARVLPCAEAHRALIAAGAETAVQALLSARPGPPHPTDADEPPPMVLVNARPAAWRDVEKAASEALAAIRQPPPGDAAPAAPADAPRCAACGKRAAGMPGGRPLMRCAGCRGPERWCSKECQRASWLGGHREACVQRQAAAAAAPARR